MLDKYTERKCFNQIVIILFSRKDMLALKRIRSIEKYFTWQNRHHDSSKFTV